MNHKKSTFRRQSFQERLAAEGLQLGVFLSQAVAHERLDVHLHILERCRAMETTYCLIMEDFVHWNPGELVESLKVAMQLPRWDVAVLGRNENQIRCDDIDPTFDRFSRLTCSPIFNYAVLVHGGYYSDLMDMFQAGDKEVCGYQTDIYFATEKLYRIPSTAFWFIASPLPVQLRSHLQIRKGDFAARCRFGLQSLKPIVMLHPMRTGGTSVCDIAAEWYPMGGRGGGGRIQNCRANLETDLDMSVVPKEAQLLYSEGAGFVALEPSFTDWEDGHTATSNRSQQRDRWYQAVHSKRSGFWTSYLTVLLVRDPIERYLSWLRFCTPTCLTNVSEDNPQAVTAYHHDCYRLGVSKFIQLLFQPRISRSRLAMASTLRFHEAEEHMFTTGCRGYHKQYHLSQASNCLTRHLLPLPATTPKDSHLTTALDVLERFDVVMDLTLSPNESSALLQDALRKNIHCGHHCDLLLSLADLMMPHSHNTRTREPLARSLSREALELLEEHNRLDRAVVAKAHQLIRTRSTQLRQKGPTLQRWYSWCNFHGIDWVKL